MATVDGGTAYRCEIHEHARDELNDVPSDSRDKLVDVIQGAARRPDPSGHTQASQLRGYEMFRVRADDHRAICALRKPHLFVLVVGEREGIYDRLDEAERRLNR